MAGGVGFQPIGWLPSGTPVPMTWLTCICALVAAIGVVTISRKPRHASTG